MPLASRVSGSGSSGSRTGPRRAPSSREVQRRSDRLSIDVSTVISALEAGWAEPLGIPVLAHVRHVVLGLHRDSSGSVGYAEGTLIATVFLGVAVLSHQFR